MGKVLRIGSRDSKLALWQAEKVQTLLKNQGVESTIVLVQSSGDIDKSTPLHLLGTTGVFTKAIDQALLDGKIDAAVHSLKDAPTNPENGIVQAAWLERDHSKDVLIGRNKATFLDDPQTRIKLATGSIRRKSQWLERFPNTEIVGIRGNVPTRIEKIMNGEADATILSDAGIQRLGLLPEFISTLDWMIPAPAQGVIGVFCRSGETESFESLRLINHQQTEITSSIERKVLNVLEGGCSAPIGVMAVVQNNAVHVRACLHSIDGHQKVNIDKTIELTNPIEMGIGIANEMLAIGGKSIIESLKNG